MPELPEVETTKEGIKPFLENKIIKKITVRNSKLRLPVPADFHQLCANKTIKALTRRAKYILVHLNTGTILIHLGMSGHLKIVPADLPPGKHDHIDLQLHDGTVLRYRDPRRFGLFLYIEENPYQHPLLAHLGPEPLLSDFNEAYLFQRMKNRTIPIKSFIMTNEIVVGVGNIYATESLFLAGINPQTPTNKISQKDCSALTTQIKKVLTQAIQAGGTTLKDFFTSDGTPGYFSIALQIYGRKNQPCYQCNNLIQALTIAGRNSAFCPYCQPLK